MVEYLYIPLILILYTRQIKYHTLIDDPVKRDLCPWFVPQGRWPPEVYEKKKSFLAVLTNLSVFMAVCGYIHTLWGWPAALLFSVFPLNVSGVVWNTGNYYSSTVLLILANHYLLTQFSWIGAFIGMLFYGAALNSTPTALSYILVSICLPYGWFNLLPLSLYLGGQRFKKMIAGRQGVHANIHVAPKITLETLSNIPKVIAYYIYLTLWPSRLAFFHSWGKDRKVYKCKSVLFFSSLVCLLFSWCLLAVDPMMALWWFAAIGLWSQFIYLGQFIAERYTYLANVAWCVVLAEGLLLNLHLPPLTRTILYAVIATLYFCKSWSYAKSYYHNERLFNDSIAAQPQAVENYNNLACCLLDKGRVGEAVRPLHAALVLSKGTTFGVHTNLANCYIMSGEYAKALYHTEEAIRQAPGDRRAQLNHQKFTLVEKIRLIERNRKKLMKEGLIVKIEPGAMIKSHEPL